MAALGLDSLGFIETSRVRFDRIVKAIAAVRERGMAVDPDAAVHGVARIPIRGWVSTGAMLSPLGAVCVDMNPSGEEEVVDATAAALLVSYAFAHGVDDGTRGRPDRDRLEDASYLRGLEFGYEVRALLKRGR